MTIELEPVAGALGAVVGGVDLRDPDLDFDAVHAALLEHEVIFFPGAHLTEAEQLALGRRFGEPSIFPVARLMGATEPKLTVIEDGPDSPNRADRWHTDVTWTATPPKVALLHAEVVPAVGGDTLWASATTAHDTLADPVRRLVGELTAIHDNDEFCRALADKTGDPGHPLIAELRRHYPPVEHPLVRTHPETGRRALLFADGFLREIAGVSPVQSRAIISMLREHVSDASLHCRWRWSPGDLAIWDERSTLHRAAGDHGTQRRVIRRLEIDGDRPRLAAPTAA